MRAITLWDYKKRMLRVLSHIQQHLDDPLELGQLARLANFSPYHFHRVFAGMVGEPLREYIRRLRLERAALELSNRKAPVIEIALGAGYQSHEAFTRAFRGAFGMSPSRFRGAQGGAAKGRSASGLHYRPDAPIKDFRTRCESMEVNRVDLPPMRVAYLRHIGPYSEVGRAWDELLPRLGKEGLLGAGTRFFGICYDDPDVTPASRIRYDAAVTLPEKLRRVGPFRTQTIPGGLYAQTTHFGPYGNLGRTYTRFLGQWLPRSGYDLGVSPCFEEYLNDPESTEPEDLVTDIYAPLHRPSPQTTQP